MMSLKAAFRLAACKIAVMGQNLSALCVKDSACDICSCVFLVCLFMFVCVQMGTSSGVSSCAGRGGRISKRSVSTRRTGRV